MFHLLKDIRGLAIAAQNEQVGTVKDVLFDDLALVVRYLVVKTGSWLSGREVLLSPSAISGIHPEDGILVSTLTREQIESSPPMALHPPVSRQHEEDLAQYYGWLPYWGVPIDPAFGSFAILPPGADRGWPYNMAGHDRAASNAQAEEFRRSLDNDAHLQSAAFVDGYSLHTREGVCGHVKDF